MARKKAQAASEGIAPATFVRSDILDPQPRTETRGRPTSYTQEAAEEICRRIAEGETLRQVCRSPHLPGESTVRSWVLDDREGFSAQYARSRELCIESWADEIMEISDNGSNDWIETETAEGRMDLRYNGDHVTRSRLRVDTRKWLLSKMKPSVYGDKTLLAGHDGAALTQPVIHVTTNPTPSSS